MHVLQDKTSDDVGDKAVDSTGILTMAPFMSQPSSSGPGVTTTSFQQRDLSWLLLEALQEENEEHKRENWCHRGTNSHFLYGNRHPWCPSVEGGDEGDLGRAVKDPQDFQLPAPEPSQPTEPVHPRRSGLLPLPATITVHWWAVWRQYLYHQSGRSFTTTGDKLNVQIDEGFADVEDIDQPALTTPVDQDEDLITVAPPVDPDNDEEEEVILYTNIMHSYLIHVCATFILLWSTHVYKWHYVLQDEPTEDDEDGAKDL